MKTKNNKVATEQFISSYFELLRALIDARDAMSAITLFRSLSPFIEKANKAIENAKKINSPKTPKNSPK